MTDAVCDAGLFIGIGLGAMSGPLGGWALLLGICSGACIVLIFRAVLRFEEEAGTGAAHFRGRAGFDPDDAIVIAPIVAAAGFSAPLLVAAAATTPVALLVIHVELARRRANRERRGDGARAAD